VPGRTKFPTRVRCGSPSVGRRQQAHMRPPTLRAHCLGVRQSFRGHGEPEHALNAKLGRPAPACFVVNKPDGP